MQIDASLGIQFLIYLFIILTLRSLYFNPLLKLIKKREELTGGKEESAQQLQLQVEELKKNYETELSKMRESFSIQRQDAVNRAREKADARIATAKSEADAKLQREIEAAQAEIKKMRTKVQDWSSEIGREIVNAITTSKVVRL